MAEKEGQLPKKKRRLSLSLKGNRFKKVEEIAVTEARKGFVPDNTARSIKWAIGNFEVRKGSLQDEDAALMEVIFWQLTIQITMFLLVQVRTRNKKGKWGPVSTMFYLPYIIRIASLHAWG